MSIQAKVEKNVGLLMVFIVLAVSVAGLVQIVPLFFQTSTTKPIPGVEPYSALRLQGRDIYIREGCYNCHSQMIRPFRAETERYGHFSVAGESVYDHPFQWGSKRTGPDLARVGGRYSDSWHRTHLRAPRDVVPESIMPNYGWLQNNSAEDSTIQKKMTVLRTLGVPYTDEQIAAAPAELKGKTEEDALVAYLQGLGLALKNVRVEPAAAIVPAAVAAPVAATASAFPSKVFFDAGKGDLNADAQAAIKAAVDALKGDATSKVDVSGYVDSTGNAAKNAELAKVRALAVRDALKAAGIDESRINMKKPEVLNGGADNKEARRVEINKAS